MTEQTPYSQRPTPDQAAPSSDDATSSAPQSRRQHVSSYAQGSVANMLRSLLVIGALMALLVVMFPRIQPAAPDVDVLETAQQVEQSTGWAISAPRDLPDGWVATRAQYLRSTDSLMTWRAGYQTPEGDYAALQETVDATDAWVAQQVNRSPLVGQVEVAGTSWDQYDRDGKIQRSLVRRGGAGEITTIITGTASWEELQVFAESLAPVRTPL